MATRFNRGHIPSQRAAGGDLESCQVGIDVRYLKRPGVGIGRYVHQAVLELLAAGAGVKLVYHSEDHADPLRSAYKFRLASTSYPSGRRDVRVSRGEKFARRVYLRLRQRSATSGPGGRRDNRASRTSGDHDEDS